MAAAYNKVYARLGLGDVTYRTYADGGIFTTRFSDEFQTFSDIGEDIIYVDEAKKIAINKEIYTDENLKKLGLDKASLVEKRGVEVGNIFPLESKYTDALDVYFIDENGKKQSIISGCYGIGVSRLVGMIAEHFADDKGLVWPYNIAPAKVYLVRIGEDDEIKQAAEKLYTNLQGLNIETLYDDRDVRPGEKFADADLMGIPYRIVISEKTLAQGEVEVKLRTATDVEMIKIENVVDFIKSKQKQ